MAKAYKRVSRSDRPKASFLEISRFISYDAEAGTFTRIGSSRAQTAYTTGRVAGYIKPGTNASGGGYLMMSIDGKEYRGHQVAWLLTTGSWPTADIDHVNGIRHDNRWINLRAATRSQNLGNAVPHSNCPNPYKGISYDRTRNKWKAQIRTGTRNKNGCWNNKFLGRFDTAEEAHEAYCRAAETRFGQFMRLR